MDVKVMAVTPEIAKQWLKTNTGNFRKLDMRRVTLYSKEMAAGQWQLNGETIKFDSDGMLLDGQHRLHAVVESGATVEMLVVNNVTASAVSMDRGKPRSLSQWLTHEGVPSANSVASVARSVLAHNKGYWTLQGWTVDLVSDSEQIQFVRDHREEIIDAVRLCSKCKFIPVSQLGAILLIGSGMDLPSENKMASWFAKSLIDGVDLQEFDPVYHLRKRLIEQVGAAAKVSLFVKRMLATIAWNKTVLNQPVKILRVSVTGPTKTELPNKVLMAHREED